MDDNKRIHPAPLSKGTLMQVIMTALPYCSQIKELDLDTFETEILFLWRDTRYKISTNLFILCKRNEDTFWSGGSMAILLEALLSRVYWEHFYKKEEEI